MAKLRSPDLDRDIRGNVMRAVRTALRRVSGYDLEDDSHQYVDELARCVADAIYECAEELTVREMWRHEHTKQVRNSGRYR